MPRDLRLLVIFIVSCQADTAPPPTLTPLVADGLRALAPDCEIEAHRDGEVTEVRSCKGPQATMSIQLDGKRRIRAIETTVSTNIGAFDAKNLIAHSIGRVVAPSVKAAIEAGIDGRAAPEVVEHVRLRVTIVPPPEGSHVTQYTISLRW